MRALYQVPASACSIAAAVTAVIYQLAYMDTADLTVDDSRISRRS